MKNLMIILFIFFIAGGLIARDKKTLDLHPQGFSKISSTTNSITSPMLQMNNDQLEVTLVHGGYFTIGTKAGASNSPLDDDCPLTFGHPYAMTSYPLFALDGDWYRIDTFFSPGQWQLLETDNSLLIEASNSMLAVTFELRLEGTAVQFNSVILNKDSTAHSAASGLVFDTELGADGDGRVFINEQFLQTQASFNGLSSVDIWERANQVKGLGIQFNFPAENPDLSVANWPQIYETDAPDISTGPVNELYDQALKFHWSEINLDPGTDKTTLCALQLTEPDFSGDAFIRWDLPTFFSMADNVMFPKDYPTYLSIDGSRFYANCTISLEAVDALYPKQDEISLNLSGSSTHFEKVNMQSRLVYKDKVVPLTITLKQGNQVLDQLTRNVYLPATPLIYTGLNILNDSVSVENFPQTDLIFGVEIEENGHRVLDLTEDNIFLYENESVIEDFTLEKFSGGGSNLADVVFVLDVSGSMGDEINQVRDNLNAFGDSLANRGFDYMIGVVTFSTTIDAVWDLTRDIEQIKHNLSQINLWGGTEDSPLALYTASTLSYRPGSKRTVIWITDEPYPEYTYTKEQIVDRMLEMGITVHGVGLMELQTDWFNPILYPTGGNFYDINGNFRDILIDVTHLPSQSRYALKYDSNVLAGNSFNLKLEVHYGGYGIIKEYIVDQPGVQSPLADLSFYPNPFNPAINFRFNPDFISGDLTIYNSLGQAVRRFDLQPGSGKCTWNALNESVHKISSGYYFVKLKQVMQSGKTLTENAKILYLK